ncbi:NtaA/DmoA family FMN-dependent monooxygenase [Nakamurella leprariae]|uniref:NtaA/DmoA family FMN-dependent monooxygenase n=1 Tax=Nakamurella leprariae TaxID=2803911 RepID=A0A938YKC3_9ACTN|nr:NtaA/DmoA family FMN-dependent monooxygenase [Nakamurella leprariae]MBM9469458.1 NtaA/DmoA family FMN-dependent monooxygenase [Nakamurella leprariae]
MLHFGWFLSYTVQSWGRTWSGRGGEEWTQPEQYIEAARALERAGFDYMMFEDGSFIPDVYGSSQDWALRNAAAAPKLDPLPLLATIARETDNIGLIGTVTTSWYPPFFAARLLTTLDHLTKGRVGMNLVTAHNIRSAENYGLQDDWDHDKRYARADEWMQVVSQLWDAWEPGAIVNDPVTRTYVDPSKVHPINFEGKYYRSRGPLNCQPGPQRRPVICQAGGSPTGREFGARHADTIIAQARGVERMKEYRDDISRRLIANGRKPQDVKVLFICDVHVFATMAEADAFRAVRENDAALNLELNLASLSFASGIDGSTLDLDAPFPELTTNNAQSVLQHYLIGSEGKTVREVMSKPISQSISFTGTPESIADEMADIAAQTGADGFLIGGGIERRQVAEVSDGLGAELRRRGLARDSYDWPTFRENLFAF